MPRFLSAKHWIFLLWFILCSVSLVIRPLFPVDETRYAAVAWEMWCRHDFLVPYLNGETYSHKPPLLFWLMQLTWLPFGVNDWSLRLISPLFALACLYLSGSLAVTLWPARKATGISTPFLLLGLFFWMVYSTLTMFDMLLAFFALLGIYSLMQLVESGLATKNWLLLGLAIGGGVLSKGPVILLHVLPVAIAAPWWHRSPTFRWRQWYIGLLTALLIGAAIALCWALPAGIAGGEAYRNAIFFGQTGGRLVESFAHRLPWWWYLKILPLLLLPWLLWQPLWTGLRKLKPMDSGLRFCLAWTLPVFIAFSVISGKRIHYLLPLVPALALIVARLVDEIAEADYWKRKHMAIALLFALLGAGLAVMAWLNTMYQWRTDWLPLSPLWGGILFMSCVAVAFVKADSAEDSVFWLCTLGLIASLTLSGAFFQAKGERYDTAPTGRKIGELMDQGSEIAFYGSKYHGQYHFEGRLKQPFTVVSSFAELTAWAGQHRNGYIVSLYEGKDKAAQSLIAFHYPFKSHQVGLIASEVLLANPGLNAVLRP